MSSTKAPNKELRIAIGRGRKIRRIRVEVRKYDAKPSRVLFRNFSFPNLSPMSAAEASPKEDERIEPIAISRGKTIRMIRAESVKYM